MARDVHRPDAPGGAGAHGRPVPRPALAGPRDQPPVDVLRSHLGTGLGQELLDEAIEDAPAYLWVAAGNDRAIAFYSRNGFRRDGATQTDEGHGDVRELRMQRP